MPRIVDRQKMQDAILDAATDVFAKTGYHAATIADVAAQAELGKGTLYLYFKGKEAIATALVDRHFARLEARVEEVPAPETLDDLVTGMRMAMLPSPRDAAFVKIFFDVFGPSFAAPEFADRVASFFERLGARYAAWIAALQEAGEATREQDAVILGRAMASMVDGVILHRGLFSIPKARQEAMADAACALVRKGLAA